MDEAAGDHYFTAQPASPAERREITVWLAEREVTVETAGGVFSSFRLDQGTRALLASVPAPPPSGDLLDLGCGWGPIALTLALRSPHARVWAVDVNERALDLVRRNAERLGLDNITAVTPDEVPDDVMLAAIWSNPPIRVGKEALHAMLLHWLPRLVPGMSAHLVVQRNLGADSLQAWLADQLGAAATVTRSASVKGFRVLRVEASSA
ncbi:class I SAM-dependent methyltransferase [Pengzhenrongella frigida]|uniref:Methyltransferase domain-containing protein n=1 Tax=Pengzhenrongella frigida TaxID=1259133 RepID=A0A4Q5N2P1_9MICO|nr:methyltransferase [Cellulomonas sp. HLT2-17]RYV52458.1 methyltransferase domain-containing protein [Cellulomonas sp. HLT2-17]